MFYLTEGPLGPVSKDIMILPLVLALRGSLSDEDGVEPGGVDDLLCLHLLVSAHMLSLPHVLTTETALVC